MAARRKGWAAEGELDTKTDEQGEEPGREREAGGASRNIKEMAGDDNEKCVFHEVRHGSTWHQVHVAPLAPE